MKFSWFESLLVCGLTLGAPLGAQVLPPFVLPSSLEVTALNGVAPGAGTGPGETIRTSSRTVAVTFSTDANPAFVWVVAPKGTTGNSAIYPASDQASALIPFGSENQAFEVRFCATAIAPSAVTTNPNRTYCGQGASVILDTEPPEIQVTALEVEGERKAYDPREPLRVNQDFTVFGTVRDNFTSGAELQVKSDFGGNEGAVTVDDFGGFEARISVANLSDGDYELVLSAEDKMSDTSKPNRSEVRIR